MVIALFAALACTGAAPDDTDVPCPDAPAPRVTLPTDDAMHAEPVEWWYYTGHLHDADGRWYGFEQTIFVFQLGGWEATSEHLAFTDIAADTFQYDVLYVDTIPEPVPSGFAFDIDGNTVRGGDGADALHATVGAAGWDLALAAGDPPVLHHGDGYTDYAVGGYTYYYSRERIAVTGTVTVDGEPRTVEGDAWFDHQYGNLIAASSAGWDWFALQLDDDREIMLFLTRGSADVIGGTITEAGCTRELTADELSVTATGTWTSPTTACTYPHGWDVAVAGERLTVTPVRADQELANEMKTYWEGAALVSGTATGRAYVELAGYCE
jgi:predicted secreted hydrolase